MIALSMCLNGAGDTLITMLTNLTTMWVFAITLAYILSQHTSLGVYGIRWAMVAGIAIRAHYLRDLLQGGAVAEEDGVGEQLSAVSEQRSDAPHSTIPSPRAGRR